VPRADAVRRYGPDLAPQPIVGLTERSPRARHETGRVDQVRGTVHVQVDGQLGISVGQMAGCPRVIQMNVGQAEVTHLGQRHADAGRPLFEPCQPGRRSRIAENDLGTDDQARPDRPVEAVEPDIDDLESIAQPRSSTGTNSRRSEPVKI
jgi:hypothetical protein